MAAYLIEHFHTLLVDLLRIASRLVVLAVIFVPLERLFALHDQKIFRKQIAVDLGYYFVNGLVPALLLGGPVALIALIAGRFMPAGIHETVGAWPLWLRASAAMVVGEIGYYWGHRWSHQIPFLWRFHAVHHSAEHIDFMVSSRAHPVDIVFSRMCMLAPLYALGLVSPVRAADGLIPLIVLFTGLIWGFFVHANVRWRLGPLEWIIATPGFHHWHHTYGGARDCNYASMLPWLDRIFGTHYLPREWPSRYGIPEPMADSLAGQLLQPLRDPAAPTAAPAPPPSEGASAAQQS